MTGHCFREVNAPYVRRGSRNCGCGSDCGSGELQKAGQTDTTAASQASGTPAGWAHKVLNGSLVRQSGKLTLLAASDPGWLEVLRNMTF